MTKSQLLEVKNKYGRGILVFLILNILLLVYKKSLDLTVYYVPGIRKTFTGRIIKKYSAKTSFIEIRSSRENILISNIAVEFWDISKIGDSLFKPKNLNYVYLVRKDTVLRLHYLYVPISVLNSSRWPVDLKSN